MQQRKDRAGGAASNPSSEPGSSPRPSSRSFSASEPIPAETVNRMILAAAGYAAASAEYKGRFVALAESLAKVEIAGDAVVRPTSALASKIDSTLVSMYENGWQPADVFHIVRSRSTLRTARLISMVIAADARRSGAADRAPITWVGQLEDLGLFDPVRNAIVGGHDDPMRNWVRAEKLDPDETLTIGLQLLGVLITSHRQAFLVDPPSKWGATNRGHAHRAVVPAADVDAKALKLIRALLAKAEATTFEAEADTFTSKAQEMMTRYSIDEAVLASAKRSADGSGPGAHPDIESRRCHIDSPYADEKAMFLSVLADVNGARSIWSPAAGFATVTGFAVDLHLTDLLFTSLLVQATRASADATAADRSLRTASFRRAFLVAYADRIGERLESTKQQAAAAAEQHYGSALVPILADRQSAVAEAAAQLFPETTTMSNRRLNSLGWYAGRNAADRAHLGAGEAIGTTH